MLLRLSGIAPPGGPRASATLWRSRRSHRSMAGLTTVGPGATWRCEGIMSYTILKVTPIYKGWGRYLIARVRLEDGSLGVRQIDDHGVAVAVLPYDPIRKVATLVRQPRTSALYAAGEADILEAPAARM